MLLYLAEYLSQFHSGFNVFQYLTLRAILGVLTALLISFLVGPEMIRRLGRYQIGQPVRDDGPQTHLVKAGTPTMGGALILVAVAIATLLWADLGNRYVWVMLVTTTLFGAIGWVDDYKKLVLKNSDGLSARSKILWQSGVALSVAMFLYLTSTTPAETSLIVPFFKNVSVDLGLWYVPMVYLVVVGASNAVNLTDGLDGLAIMPTVLVAGFDCLSADAEVSSVKSSKCWVIRSATPSTGVQFRPSEYGSTGARDFLRDVIAIHGDLAARGITYKNLPPVSLPSSLDVEVLGQVESTVVANSRHPLARLKKVPRAELVDAKWVTPELDLDEDSIFEHLLKVAPAGETLDAVELRL